MQWEDGNDSGVYLDVTIMWKHGLHSTSSKPVSEPTTAKSETDTKQITPAPPMRKPQESVDIIKDSSSNDSNDDVFSPVAVRSPKIPSVTEIDDKEDGTATREDIETISLKDSSRASNTPVTDAGANGDKGDRKSSSSSANSQTGTFDVERPSSRESAESVISQTERTAQADTASQKAEDQAAKAREKKEKDKNEIRSLLGDLPPIAKPRLSKPPSEFTSLASMGRPKHESEESSSRSKTSSENDELRERQRAVFFTDPLHKSIPPSETSSVSSPPPRPPVRLPAKGGRSAIRVMNVTPEDDSVDSDESRTVSIFIDRIYVPEFSRLLHPSYDGVKVYVDWFFLDYPLEESRTPEAISLPRVPDKFQLSKRRVALLEQWVELGNRLDFTLITEGEDSEELAVAQLELSRTATDETTTIQFLDINGEHYADLDLVVSYPPQIFDCLKT
ncbi:unnamed protein product [Cylicostephanus goldi]|uniref:RPGRIP1 C-terminal domain-containing protein n=1 Tax=Cylicostephanus goldi TaxID=71465 RepID=A0A3P6Q5C3_CYLGO|nr:unnamed protein product [Cylicostephanus goldi]